MPAGIRRAQEHDEGGFTLIELLVVMIIIGVLAAIAIPAFLSQKKKGYEASEKSDLRSIATEITTALVNLPTGIALAQPGGAGSTVTVTPAGSAAGNMNISPGNSLFASSVNVTTGAYCVALKNPGTGNDWRIAGGSATAPSQSLNTFSSTALAAAVCP